MKLAALYLDDAVVIPGGKQVGDDAQGRYDLRDTNAFRAADGWDLHEVSPGRFTLQREGMPEPVTVGGYGYSFVVAPEPPRSVADQSPLPYAGDGYAMAMATQAEIKSYLRKGKR